MKTSQIVHQLKAVLPKYCDDFSDSINITNIAVNGTNITYTTDGNHHIEDGNTFLVCDVKNYYEIISLKKIWKYCNSISKSTSQYIKDLSNCRNHRCKRC